jgi:fatty-acyl-CoA synthase
MKLHDATAIKNFEKQPLIKRELPNSTYEVLKQSAEQWGNAPALRFFFTADSYRQSWYWSYAQLLEEVTQFSNAFTALGLGSEDIIALVLPNLPETHFCIWGGEATGVVMPLNPMLEGEQLGALLRTAGVNALVTMDPNCAPDIWQRLEPQLEFVQTLEHLILVDQSFYDNSQVTDKLPRTIDTSKSPYKVHQLIDLISDQPKEYLISQRQIKPHEPSSYFCTGGTTGLPKIAVRTHGAEVFDAWALGAVLGSENVSNTYFCGLPLFHVNAQLVTGLQVWMTGGEVILGTPNGYRTPGLIEEFWRIVEHYRINVFSGVPTIYASLLQLPRNADISSLDFGLCGAAPLPSELFHNFERETGVRILEGYGLTEATCVSSINPLEGERKIGSIGLRLPYQPMRAVIVGHDGSYIRNADLNEVGAIVISGPNLFQGYLNEKHNFGAWLNIEGDSWFNSGDLGYQDKDGYFWLTGRSKELIIRGGHNIDPKQIEEAISKHPSVSLVAAIGSPDAYAGEVPVAYVQLIPGSQTSSNELLAFAAKHIPERAAIPRDIHILKSIPTTAVGKLFKPALQQLEITNLVRRIAEEHSLNIDVDVTQSVSSGLVVKLTGADCEKMRTHLGHYALQIEYSTLK